MRAGVVAGFGSTLGGPDLDELTALGVGLVRGDVTPRGVPVTDAALSVLLAEFVGRPFRWLAILPNETHRTDFVIGARQVVRLARAIGLSDDRYLIELGNELDLLPWSVWADNPRGYGDCCLAAYTAVRAIGYEGPVISGGVSNTNTAGRAWLNGMDWSRLPADLLVGIHRYAPLQNPAIPFPGFATRDQELRAVRAVVAGHRLAMTETGYHTAPFTLKSGWGKTTKKQLTDEQAAVCLVQELDFWAKQPDVTCACLYQWIDGPSDAAGDRFGLNRHGVPPGLPRRKPQFVAVQEWIAVHAQVPPTPDPPPVEPEPPVIARSGLVRVSGKAMLDDTGMFHPRGKSFFWALQAWKRNRDKFKHNAEFLAPYVDYFRILGEVGTGGNPSSAWAGNDIDPTTPEWADYQEMLRGVLDWCYTQLGVRVEITVLGKGTSVDPLWLSKQIADVIADGRQHMVLDVEMVNEHFSGHLISLATMQQMAAIFKATIPNVLALSNPKEGAVAWDAMEAATMASKLAGFTVHHRRKALDNGWAHVRQGYDNKNTRLAVLNNEPAGPGSSVETQTSVLQLVMTRAVSVMCGGAAYVFHTGTGVFGDGKPHPSAGPRPANFWEIPNVTAMLTALRALDQLLPQGVEHWAVKNTQRVGVPFDLPKSAHWGVGNEESSGWGVNKAYAAVSPTGAFIQMPIGVKTDAAHRCQMTATFNMTGVTVFDPLTLAPVAGLESFGVGDTLDLPGRSDSMAAYIIKGQKA